MREAQLTPPVKVRSTRRHSDRVRSPSDSSGSDSDMGARARKISGTAAFPEGPSQMISSIPRPVAQRAHHLSRTGPSHDIHKDARRKGNQQPPSAYSPFGAFARPSPASRRRRGSTESAPAADVMSDESSYPRPTSQTRVRKISQPSLRASSPLWSGSQPSNPGSPLFPTFNTHRQQSRSWDDEIATLEEKDVDDADHSLDLDDQGATVALEELDQLGDDLSSDLGQQNGSLNPRLSRISVSGQSDRPSSR